MVDVFHRAARDGYIDILKSATKRDTNRKDEDGMTPVHYAASCGNVEALRLLVGKGGDPDKPNYDGATAVHLAANCGQLNCLSFLTNFGCNIWALNNDGRTPLEDAAYHGRMDCVRHLDGLIAIQMMRNKKEVEKQKLHAKREAIKRVKKQSKRQQEREKAYERRVRDELKDQYDSLGRNDKIKDSNSNSWSKRSIRSTNPDQPFSELASGRGFSKSTENIEPVDHKYSDTFSQRSKLFQALKGKINSTLRGRRKSKENDDDFFTKRSSLSQPDLYSDSMTSRTFNSKYRTPSMRSGSITSHSSDENEENDLQFGHIIKTYDNSGNVSTQIHYDHSSSSRSNGTVKSSRKRAGSGSSVRSGRSNGDGVSLRSAGYDDTDVFNEMAESDEVKAVITFLSSLNLEQFAAPLIKESIDLPALVLCSDKDLQELGLPLGPRRKILEGARKHQMTISSPSQMTDTKI
ncbi:Usher syndrome type-1G protein [Exaiptasia diaphana]|uniref:SAM domain-containing protein n=1 Tax=Exaiptasia diaphana TaxID=2652724 RepID=A0A913Y168_EXADI|nr:Usher syndrome type-1G protein [Exaiptasia diaphana]KXJ23645.1 Usher syndrome type-1G protein [Exaiptasia diaphana]